VVLTHAAQDLYAAGDQARAAQSAQALLARTPPVDAAKQRIAWTIVGQVSFNQGDYPQAENAFTHALAAAAANDPERGDITERLAAAVYKQADAKRTAGDQAGAAQDFLRVGRIAPGSKVVATSQYDAAAALINTQQWDQAIAVLEAYRRDYPKGEYNADVERKLAVAYEQGGHAAQAAAQYEHIAENRQEDRAVVREAIVKAADLYAQSGDTARSAAMLERLVRDYPTPVVDAIEVRQRLLDAAAKSGNLERQRYWQREIVKADASAGSGRTDRTKYLAARAQLALAEPTRDAFRATKLVAPLKQTLTAKRKAMESAVQAYKEVAEYQVAQTTTAATYETAELYRTLAHDLMASERPKKLSADELEQYDTLLEEQAFPFEEQAIAIHEINAKRAPDGVYDESVRKSFDALAQLKPARYGKIEHSEAWIVTLTAPSAAAPGAAAPSSAALADYERAAKLANSGKQTEAELQLQQFELQYPGFAAPAIDLGLLARAQGKLQDSEDALRRATVLDPTNATAWSELGVTLRQEGKFTDAGQPMGKHSPAMPRIRPRTATSACCSICIWVTLAPHCRNSSATKSCPGRTSPSAAGLRNCERAPGSSPCPPLTPRRLRPRRARRWRLAITEDQHEIMAHGGNIDRARDGVDQRGRGAGAGPRAGGADLRPGSQRRAEAALAAGGERRCCAAQGLSKDEGPHRTRHHADQRQS
jgi:tetratricopeptide (TPR) repeat protein